MAYGQGNRDAAMRHVRPYRLRTLQHKSMRRKMEFTCAKLSDRPAVRRTTQSRSIASVPAAPISSAKAENRRIPMKHTDTGTVHVMEGVGQPVRDSTCSLSPALHIRRVPSCSATPKEDRSMQLATMAPFWQIIDVHIMCRRGA